MNNSSKSARLDAAVSAFKRGEFIDYSAAAREYNVSRTAVSKRVRGITSSRAEVNSNLHQALTTPQEEVLITRINYLSGRGLPPTTAIVKNLAEEIRGAPVGKNWAGQFVHRYSHQLKSLYLRNIDNIRVSSEYAPIFEFFFTLVCSIILLIPVIYSRS